MFWIGERIGVFQGAGGQGAGAMAETWQLGQFLTPSGCLALLVVVPLKLVEETPGSLSTSDMKVAILVPLYYSLGSQVSDMLFFEHVDVVKSACRTARSSPVQWHFELEVSIGPGGKANARLGHKSWPPTSSPLRERCQSNW